MQTQAVLCIQSSYRFIYIIAHGPDTRSIVQQSRRGLPVLTGLTFWGISASERLGRGAERQAGDIVLGLLCGEACEGSAALT